MDTDIAFAHTLAAVTDTDTEEESDAHLPREIGSACTVVWLWLKAHSGAGKAARWWQEFFRDEAVMSAEHDAVVVGADVHYIAEELHNDDDANMCVHGDDFMMESRNDVFQDVKAMLEHKIFI